MERLQKWLAASGIGSRREIDAWIAAGRVMVDGQVARPGTRVLGSERISIDGRILHASASPPAQRVLLYHKPVGEVCTRSDPSGRPLVFERLPALRGARWVSVGRLDVDTSGLLIFTTDGALAHGLTHPSRGMVREYAVRVRGTPSDQDLQLLTRGIPLDDGAARFATLDSAGGTGANRWYRVTVTEGRNRIVRRLWEAIGCQVSRLIRIRFGPVALPEGLARGRVVELTGAALGEIYAAAGLAAPGGATGSRSSGRSRRGYRSRAARGRAPSG